MNYESSLQFLLHSQLEKDREKCRTKAPEIAGVRPTKNCIRHIFILLFLFLLYFYSLPSESFRFLEFWSLQVGCI